MSIFTRFSLKNILVIFLMIAMLVAGGVYSAGSIQTEMMPNIQFPFIYVITVYPGAAPDEIAESISRPIQKAVSGVQGINKVESVSNENLSMVMVSFNFSKDMEKAEREVQDAVNKVTVPEKAQKPSVMRIGYGSIPVIGYAVSAGNKSEDELSKLMNDKVQPSISGIKGVGGVGVEGLYDKNVFIKLDEKKLKDNGLTSQDVQQALSANDLSFPMGTVDISGKSMPLRVSRKITSLNDIKSIPVIVPPDTSKIMGDSMSKMGEAIGGVYTAVGQMGKAMGDMGMGMTDMGKGMADIGSMLGSNMQAVGILAEMQKNQNTILTQNVILSNSDASQEDKAKAKQAIMIASQTNIAMQQMLDGLLKKAADEAGKASLKAGKQAGVKKQDSINMKMPSENNAKTQDDSGTQPKIELKTVFLGDLGDVTFEKPEGTSYSRMNLKDTVTFYVFKNDGSNTVQIAKDVEKKVEELRKETGLEINKVMDTSTYITSSINGMTREGLFGALFAILVIAIFLRDLRATLIAVISIPLSVIIALIIMPRFGITLNMMSLSGMAVAVGRIVDDSIVVIENIYRRLTRSKDADDNLIQNATKEVSSAITSSTITTVAVFLPLGFVEGFVGRVFMSFAITVASCIAASLLVAITVVPVFGKLTMMKRPPKLKKDTSIIENGYKKLLSGALSRRWIVVLTSIVLLVLSSFMVSRLGVQFLPPEESKTILANLSLPAGSSLDATNKESLKMEEYLTKNPKVETVLATVGDTGSSGASFGANQSMNQAGITIIVKDNADAGEALKEIKAKAKTFENGNVKWKVAAMDNYGSGAKLEVVVTGDDLNNIKIASETAAAKLKEVTELSNIANNLADKKPEISINVDSVKAAEKGLNPIFVAGLVRSVLNYDKISTVEVQGKSVDLRMGIGKKDLSSIEKIRNFQLKGMTGEVVKVGEIADVTLQDGPVSISERDGKRYASVTADISSKDTAKVSAAADKKLEAIRAKYPDVKITVGGSVDDINSSFSQMGMAMLIAILLVFIILVLTFKEAAASFAILFSLPFAAVGALFALVIANRPLSMSGMVGLLMLIGIVVTNAIVLVDRVQANRRKGMVIREALIEAGSVRLRPIIMTAAATVMALLPLALGFSEGAIISEELGIVVIGGLTMSTLLTLIVVPVAYSILEGIKSFFVREKVIERDRNSLVVPQV